MYGGCILLDHGLLPAGLQSEKKKGGIVFLVWIFCSRKWNNLKTFGGFNKREEAGPIKKKKM